jgi:hypothetical protein
MTHCVKMGFLRRKDTLAHALTYRVKELSLKTI